MGTPSDDRAAHCYRSLAARVNYLAQDRLDIACAAKELCRRMVELRCVGAAFAVSCATWLGLRTTGVYARQNEEDGAKLGSLGIGLRGLRGGVGPCRAAQCSGIHIAQRNIAPSFAEGELGALVHTLAQGTGAQCVLADLHSPLDVWGLVCQYRGDGNREALGDRTGVAPRCATDVGPRGDKSWGSSSLSLGRLEPTGCLYEGGQLFPDPVAHDCQGVHLEGTAHSTLDIKPPW